MFDSQATLPSDESAFQARMTIRETEFDRQLKTATAPFGWRELAGSGALGIVFVAALIGLALTVSAFIR